MRSGGERGMHLSTAVPQFIASARGAPPSINHYCLGMEDSTPVFRDPDGILVQIQDVGYCGGSGVLGDLCDPDDRP